MPNHGTRQRYISTQRFHVLKPARLDSKFRVPTQCATRHIEVHYERPDVSETSDFAMRHFSPVPDVGPQGKE